MKGPYGGYDGPCPPGRAAAACRQTKATAAHSPVRRLNLVTCMLHSC
jgi:hypothetical protein